MTTVSELIELLKGFPPDWPVTDIMGNDLDLTGNIIENCCVLVFDNDDAGPSA